MKTAVLILVSSLLLGIPLSFLLFPRSRFTSLLTALVLIGLALFGVFGFMASYEYSEGAKRLPWQVGYTVLCLTSLGGAVMLLRSHRHSKRPTSTDTTR